mmetsp:Transcript_21276/g.29836  ORF Transcript_21276/g.29836 Transcript_21276/m.29836 type:complete len:185 (-) Transcript_21276:146-700(-)
MNCVIMFSIWRCQLVQAERNVIYRNGWRSSLKHEHSSNLSKTFSSSKKSKTEGKSHSPPTALDQVAADLSKISPAEEQRLQCIRNRAYSYAFGFFFIYISTAIFRISESYLNPNSSFVVVLLSRIMFPLQGFFNMVIYTYPHVRSYSRKFQGKNCIISWMRAFLFVVKSGGDSDAQTSRRRSQM